MPAWAASGPNVNVTPSGIALHDIRRVPRARVAARSPTSIVTVAPEANLSVLSPSQESETGGIGLVRAERSIVEPSCIVGP